MINKDGKLSKRALKAENARELQAYIRGWVIDRVNDHRDDGASISFEFALAMVLNSIPNLNELDFRTREKLVNMRENVVRVNLQSGKYFVEDADTPNYCSPASEAYWSM